MKFVVVAALCAAPAMAFVVPIPNQAAARRSIVR